MVKRCKLCDAELEEDRETEKEICHSCLHHGFVKLKQVLSKMKDSEDG